MGEMDPARHVASRELEPGHEFYCPMDPQVVRSTYEPNGDVPKCPICGMPLSLRKKGEAAKLPEGITGRVQLSPERIQLAGIKTVPVEYRPMAKQTKTVGYVTFDESRLSRIVSRVEGYVEKLYVDETFTVVHKGDPLAEIYSPELYSTARELVLATPRRRGGDLAAAARNKLLLLGVSPQEIDGIVASGQPSPRLVIRSPQTGYVVEKKIVVGRERGSEDDAASRWPISRRSGSRPTYTRRTSLFSKSAKRSKPRSRLTPIAPSPESSHSSIPQLDAATRTNRIRFELDNPRARTPSRHVRHGAHQHAAGEHRAVQERGRQGGRVTAGSSGRRAAHDEFLTVPERAVMDTGSKKVVYVEREPGLFEGVEVELGPRQVTTIR